jgi:hypothetical protein
MRRMYTLSVRILSNKESKTIPKSETTPHFRAKYPSKKSVTLAREKKPKIIQNLYGISKKKSSIIIPVKIPRKRVSVFGRYFFMKEKSKPLKEFPTK